VKKHTILHSSGTPVEEEHEALCKQLASDMIGFERAAVKHFDAAAGIFLRQLLYRTTGNGALEDAWIWKSISEWYEETGLRRRAQEGARKRLVKAGAIRAEQRLIHGRWTWCFRLQPGKVMEILGNDLPHAKSTMDDVTGTMDDVTGTMVSRSQGITEDYTEEDTKEVSSSPFRPTASCEKILRRIEGFPANATDAVDKLVKTWPEVDAEEVCERFEFWHLENPGRTNGLLAQLETFLVNESIEQFMQRRARERNATTSFPAEPDSVQNCAGKGREEKPSRACVAESDESPPDGSLTDRWGLSLPTSSSQSTDHTNRSQSRRDRRLLRNSARP
jgi:hypothetical protein